MVDWMMRTDRRAFDAFFRDVDAGVAVDAALRNHYGKSIQEVERLLSRYASGRQQFAMTIAVPSTDTFVVSAPLDRASLLYELGRFLAGIDDLTAEAERHFREALVANPTHARSIAALGLLRANDKRYDEATPYFERALAADPNDADIYLDYAEALLRNQIGVFAETEEPDADDVSHFRQARALAEKALEVGGGQAPSPVLQGRALAVVGISYLVESDLAPGIAALEKARALLPGRMDLALHLFAMYRRIGDRAKADPLFALLDSARSPQVAYAARTIMMRVEMARVNTLAKQQKLDEAAGVLRGLAAETSDADARDDLVKQAVEIERVAKTNREIEVYNQAIGQVNRGDYAAALKTLNQLLAAATDPSVIRDAKKLQKMVSGRKKS